MGHGEAGERGPGWKATFTSGADRRASERPERFEHAPCSLRGAAPGIPRRWTMGHLAIGNDELTWWRHLGRRRTPVRIPIGTLRSPRTRVLRWWERWRVSGRCTVVSCETDGGEVELALRYPDDADVVLRAIGPPPPDPST